MQAPSASELLAVWERAGAESATIQALTLLEAASPGTSKQELAKLSVGRRDGRLLELRELLFGSRLIGLAACPNCKQQLEIEIESANIRVDQDRAAAGLLSTSSGEYSARFRLPNSDDLKELTECRDPQRDETTAISKLVSRCLVDLRRNGRRQ